MAARQSLDDKLTELRALRGQTLTDEQKAEPRKRIGDRSNLVVAAAAAIAGENALVELAKDLGETRVEGQGLLTTPAWEWGRR